MPKHILLFSYHQFGQLTDTYKYAQYSNGIYKITYLGWDYGKTKQHVDGVKIIDVSRAGNLFIRNFRLLRALNSEIRRGKYDVVFVHYTRGIAIIKILNWGTRFILDIRTLSINPKYIQRNTFNFFLKLESFFFKEKSVISDRIAKRLKIRNYELLPLGADCMNLTRLASIEEGISLLYVGTLQNRNIIKCVKGFKQYLIDTGDDKAKMTIVGDSFGNELSEIKKYIADKGLADKVLCTGRVAHDSLSGYFARANIGIAFIPLTKWYNYQPPTKTYEYLLAGLPVIATKTYENIKLLKKEDNCVLIDDTSEDFAKAIEMIKIKMEGKCLEDISKKYMCYQWKNIVDNKFLPLINGNKKLNT